MKQDESLLVSSIDNIMKITSFLDGTLSSLIVVAKDKKDIESNVLEVKWQSYTEIMNEIQLTNSAKERLN